MKKIIIIMFCFLLIGCKTNKTNITETKTNSIEITHNNYYLKWFNENVGKEEEIKTYTIDDRIDFVYLLNDVGVNESYNINTQSLSSYYIYYTSSNINTLIRLVIYHNCNISNEEIDKLIENIDYFEKHGNCTISKYKNDNTISYTISV